MRMLAQGDLAGSVSSRQGMTTARLTPASSTIAVPRTKAARGNCMSTPGRELAGAAEQQVCACQPGCRVSSHIGTNPARSLHAPTAGSEATTCGRSAAGAMYSHREGTMDSSHYEPSAVTRLLAPAVMLALATWLLADAPPADTGAEAERTRSASAVEEQRPARLQEAGVAGTIKGHRVAASEGQRP